ncbi:U2 small nuclear ribonucleoprotein auxiliary factor 35 kDa subunit-related protein 1-like isoform X2 [Neolamprologus brichardi]|uniref:U2 small nuclear ribonucleoprotein auxiliary factor 35 kDa subunit-related protein 1-like isoform X2 n=1 Tax=Neolamprologus brichardi TaxID=32507 RepID=UPI001643B011|nr:U2 small nuclear ribonucleoprotein auxiliary factor 35 kDa subunit-related protein 1-like isoform X2 [Neolamprologus brichardi]
MTHEKRFQGIPMSKSMRGLCKEEDYAFLRTSERTEGAAALGNDWRDRKEERVRRRLEQEQQEKKRLREIEESKKEFQKKVMEEESGEEGAPSSQAVNQLFTRM